MKIHIFEDFKQDTGKTSEQRYPGSVYSNTDFDPDVSVPCFSLLRSSVDTRTRLTKASAILNSDEAHVALMLDDNGQVGTRSANIYLRFYGLPKGMRFSANATDLILRDGAATVATQALIPFSGAASIKKLYFIISGTRLSVFVDDAPLLVEHDISSWGSENPEPFRLEVASAAAASVLVPIFPTMLTGIVVATDVPEGKMLDLSSLQFKVAALEAANPLGMEFSDQGFVADVDKADPTQRDPNVFSTGASGSIGYTWEPDPEVLAIQVYAAGRSTDGRALIVDDQVILPGEVQQVVPVVESSNGQVPVEMRYPRPLILTLTTEAGNSVFSPRFTGGQGIIVDWGDNTEATRVGSDTRSDHIYTNPGEYTVKIYGQCDTITLASSDITGVQDWGELNFTNFAFYKPASSGDPVIQSLKLVSVPNWLPPTVTSLYYSFAYCRAFDDPNIDLWSVLNLVSINRAFGNSGITDRLGPWFTPNLQDMNNAFSGTSFNGPIENWYVGNVTNMTALFASNPAFNRNLTKWCVSKIPSEPSQFAASAPLLTQDKRPIWGTCPVQGEPNG